MTRAPTDTDWRIADGLVVAAHICRGIGYGALAVGLVFAAVEITAGLLAGETIAVRASASWGSFGVVLLIAYWVIARHVRRVTEAGA